MNPHLAADDIEMAREEMSSLLFSQEYEADFISTASGMFRAEWIQRYKVEIHKKYSIPFACVVFVLVGSPLAIRMSRSGMNMAIGLSILFFLVYYVCLIGGEKLADRGFTTPFLAMWSPNIGFSVLALLLLKKAASEQALFERPSFSFLRARKFRRHAAANSR